MRVSVLCDLVNGGRECLITVDFLLYLKCFTLHLAHTPPLQRGSRADGSERTRIRPRAPFQCLLQKFFPGVSTLMPAHCRWSIPAWCQPPPRFPWVPAVQPTMGFPSAEQEPERWCPGESWGGGMWGRMRATPVPGHPGGQDRQGTSPGVLGPGDYTGNEGRGEGQEH